MRRENTKTNRRDLRERNSHNHDFDPNRAPLWIVLCVIVVSILVVSVAIMVGYGVTSLIYRFTGKPPILFVNVFSGITGFLLVGGVWRILAQFHMHIHRHGLDGKRVDSSIKFMDKTIDAMNRIAQGDFTVFLPIDKNDPFHHLTESVNKMAKELGSMENLRQDFISNVSHEIQSPLTSISGFAALLKKNNLSHEQAIHYLDIIETEAKRLSKLSDNLLKLSSLESNLEPLVKNSFLLNKQIENAVLMLEPQWADKQLNLELSLDKIEVIADEALLSQVWINLLHNAVKFTPEQGSLMIALTQSDDFAVCSISDTGPGISSEDQIHIFERFYKADKSRDRSLGGNGLGLSLVKKIVEIHGGIIYIKSELGKGTVFSVEIPRNDGTPQKNN